MPAVHVAHRTAHQLGAVEADTSEDLHNCCDEANVIHRLGQLNVPKVTWAVLNACPISLTLESAVQCAHFEVAEATRLGFALFIRLADLNFDDRVSPLHVA